MATGRVPGPLGGPTSPLSGDDGLMPRAAGSTGGSVGAPVDRTWDQVQADVQSLLDLLAAGPRSPQTDALIEHYRERIQAGRSELAMRAVGRIGNIRRDVWTALTGEQRMAALVEVHRVYAAAFGMTPTTVRFTYIESDPPGRTIWGRFWRHSGVLEINEKAIVPDFVSPAIAVVELVCTAVHETWHYIQWRAVRFPKTFPTFTRAQTEAWAEDYRRQSKPETHAAYRAQAVEADGFKVETKVRAFLYPEDASSNVRVAPVPRTPGMIKTEHGKLKSKTDHTDEPFPYPPE